jgi:hypothetical protein
MYAKLAKIRFGEAGYRAWVWHEDSVLGQYTHEEIANQIDYSDHFVYINSSASHGSGGQQFERSTALALNKTPLVLKMDGAYLSPVLAACNRIHTNAAGFEGACDKLADQVSRLQDVRVPSVADTTEGSSLVVVRALDGGKWYE